MTLRVLEGGDRAEWLRLWAATGREPFAHPDYADLFAGPGERHVCLVTERDEATSLVPFMLRPVEGDGLDACSPYGYGGPFGAPAAWDEVVAWMRSAGVVSAFVRLALDAGPIREDGVEEAEVAPNVVVDLRAAEDEVWRRYEHKVRKNVKKAGRAGLTVRESATLEDAARFRDVYADTMSRRDAASWYCFDEGFFRRISIVLAGSYRVFEVVNPSGEVVSVELVLESDTSLYSFLGGTLASAFPHAPNDLLKHAVIGAGRRDGKSRYVLGGGASPGDGIFRYKRSFDPGGVVPFRVLRIVADAARYGELVRAAGEVAPAGFFPAYRAPSA